MQFQEEEIMLREIRLGKQNEDQNDKLEMLTVVTGHVNVDRLKHPIQNHQKQNIRTKAHLFFLSGKK